MGLSEKTAMPELLKWHKRYLRLSALYSSMKESKLPLMNGTYMLVSKRLAFVRSIWGIYYDILDGISHNDPTLSKELLRLKQEKRKMSCRLLEKYFAENMEVVLTRVLEEYLLE